MKLANGHYGVLQGIGNEGCCEMAKLELLILVQSRPDRQHYTPAPEKDRAA